MKPMCRLRQPARADSLIAETSSPPTRTCPEVGRSMPAIRFKSVVLPEPDGPIKATKSPASTLNESPSRTVRTCVSRVYCLTTDWTWISGSAMSLLFLLDPDLLFPAPARGGGRGVGDDLLAAGGSLTHLD